MKKNISYKAIAFLLVSLMLVSSFAILLPNLLPNVAYAQESVTFTSGDTVDFTSDTEMQFKGHTSMQFWSGETMKFSTNTEMSFRSGKTMQFWSGVQMKFRTNITMQFIETVPNGVLDICDWIQILWPIGYIPPECSWWEVLDPDTGKGLGEIHIDGFEPPNIVHIDNVWPGPVQVPIGAVIKAYKKIDVIKPCEYFEVHWPSDWWPDPCTWWEIVDPETGELTGYEFHVDWTNESCEFHVDKVIPEPYYPAFPAFEIWARRKIPDIKTCDYFVVEEPPGWWPERCSWWEILTEDGEPTGYNFHVDWTNESCEFHVDTMHPGPYTFDFPVPYVIAEQKIEEIKSCDWFIVVDPAGFVPEQCSWWEILDDTGQPTGLEFHVDVTDGISMFHVDIVYPDPLVIPPSYTVRVRKKIDIIESCRYFEVHWPAHWWPEPCTWWEIVDPETGELTGYEFHVDWTNESCEFHVDLVIPGPYIAPFPVYEIWARKKIPGIKPCDYFVVEEPPHWWPPICTWWEIMDFWTGEPTGYNFHVDWTNESCEFHVEEMDPSAYVFKFPVPYVIAEQKIEEITTCDWFIIVDPPGFLPERCSWWEVLDNTGQPTGLEFHVDVNDGFDMFHVDSTLPGEVITIPPIHTVTARKKIDTIGECDVFKVDDPANTPDPCTWWEVLDSTGNPTGWEFHVGDSTTGYFHVDYVIPGPIPIPPTHMLTAEKKIDDIQPCDWFMVIDPPTGWVPEPCSWWQITSPNEWAGVTFHVDMSGMGMFHIDKVSALVPAPPTPPPYSVTAVPYELPPPPPPPEDLELYPREVVDLEDPTDTQWHELYPNTTYYYDLVSWVPGEVLSPEDEIDMYLIEPPVTVWMETGFVDPLFPFGSEWHELEPTFSQWWLFSSWEDNNGDGYLSPSDQIDMTNMDTGEVVWFHVQSIEPPGPEPGPRMMWLDVKYWFQVDEVTVDMSLSPVEGGPQIFIEYKCGYWTFDAENPISTKWNQIEPQVGPVRCLHLTSWEDLDADRKLSPGDVIDVTPLHPNPGPVEWYYVDFMSISLMLNPKPLPPIVPPPPVGPVYLESELSYDEFDLTSPVCTFWHEIHPIYCRIWHLSSWHDRLGFSPSDQIILALKDEFGDPIPGTEAEYHVDKLTVAMNMTSMFDGLEHIVKFEGSLKQFKVYYWTDPISSQWHEVNPEYCRQWHLLDWLDSDADGRLGFCDYMLMIDKHTGWIEEFHVESLSTDMYVTPLDVPDVAVTNVTSPKTVVCQTCCGNVTVTVENQGTTTETFDVTLYADNIFVQKKGITLTSGASANMEFLWNATGWAKGNYTLKAVADIVPGETDTTDNTYIDDWVIVSMLGDITGPDGWPDGKCNIKDVALVAKKFGVIYPDPRYDPNCDLTGPTKGVADGKIDIKDVALVAKHFGDIDP